MDKISGVYKITNTVTGDFYIGSSMDMKSRWANHKCLSTWKRCSNSKLYQDMAKYGLDFFSFEILKEVYQESLKQEEQKFIDMLKPSYNTNNASGFNVEKLKAAQKKYFQTTKGKHAQRKYDRKLCEYNGETIKFGTLRERFYKAGIPHATLEAKKYLKNTNNSEIS